MSGLQEPPPGAATPSEPAISANPQPAAQARGAAEPWLFRTLLYFLSFYVLLHLAWFYENPAAYVLASFIKGLPTLLLLVIPALLPAPLSRPYLLISYIFLALPSFLCTLHLTLFQVPVTSQSFFVAFYPSLGQANALLSNGSFWQVWVFGALIILAPAWLLHRALKLPHPGFGKTQGLAGVILAVPALLICFAGGPAQTFRANLICDVYLSFAEYKTNVNSLRASLNNNADLGFSGVRLLTPAEEERTLVVVIGESVNRNHWSLYGYFRNTTPGLAAISGELIIFEDIISASALTAPSLDMALTLPASGRALQQDNRSATVPPRLSVLTLFNQAGFHTYWLSNQAAFQNRYLNIMLIAAPAGEHIFLNRGGDQNYHPGLDGAVLPHLERILRDDPGRKVIFIHLMGSRAEYDHRYPLGAERFTGSDNIPVTDWRNRRSLEYINSYDNSIVYTDHVLKAIIDLTRRLAPESLVLYFADHGEEVFDALPRYGHEDSLDSARMYEIPFILWLSDGFKAANRQQAAQWMQLIAQRGTLKDLPYTLADLGGLTFHGYSRERSLLSGHYRPESRIILGEDFDLIFPGQDNNYQNQNEPGPENTAE